MAQITYTNKETLNSQPSIADKNKVKAEDMNEIKSVVNTNYGEVGDITNLNTTNKTSIVNGINSILSGLNGTILWSGQKNTTGIVDLNDDITNYDILEIIEGAGDLNRQGVFFVDVASYIQNAQLNFFIGQTASVWTSISLRFPTNTTCNVEALNHGTWLNPYLLQIKGIKL